MKREEFVFPPPPHYSAEKIVSMRNATGHSQTAWARALGIPVSTLAGWENDRRKPRGPARRLLQIVEMKGIAFVEAC